MHGFIACHNVEEGVLMDDSRFSRGDYVVYGTSGICMIEDIRLMKFAMDSEKSTYYVLKPESSDSSVVYVPAKNEKLMSKMREVMTKDEIDSLLLGMKDKEIGWEKTDVYVRRFFTISW